MHFILEAVLLASCLGAAALIAISLCRGLFALIRWARK